MEFSGPNNQLQRLGTCDDGTVPPHLRKVASLFYGSNTGSVKLNQQVALMAIFQKLQNSEWAILHLAKYLANTSIYEDAVDRVNTALCEHGLIGSRWEDSYPVDEKVCQDVVLAIIINHLIQKNELAYFLLCICAVCYPQDLWEDLIGSTGRDIQALKALESFGILARSDTQTLRLDPVVADNFPSFIDDEEWKTARSSATLAMEKVFPSGQFETWSQCDRCLPLAILLIDAGRQDTFILPLIIKVTRYLTEKSRFPEARKYLLPLEELIRYSNLHETKTIEALLVLASLKYELGMYEEAKSDAITALEASKNSADVDGILVLQCKACLGRVYRRSRKHSESFAITSEALKDAQEQLRSKDAFVLSMKYDLSRILIALESRSAGQELLEDTLKEQMEVLPRGHPDLMVTWTQHAGTLLSQSNFEEGLQLAEKGMQICKEYLGDSHINTLLVTLIFCRFLPQKGRFQEYSDLTFWCFTQLDEFLGPDHQDTMIAMEEFVAAARYVKDNALIVKFRRTILQHRVQFHGPTARDTLNSKRLLAWSLCMSESRDDHSEAATLLQETPVSWDNQDWSHDKSQDIDYLDCKGDFAYALAEQTRLTEAEELYWEVLNRYRALLGRHNHRTLRISTLLGSFYLNENVGSGDAEPLLRATLQARTESLGCDHPDNAVTLSLIAQCARRRRNFKESVYLYEQSLELFQKHWGESHEYTEQCRANIERARRENIRDRQLDSSRSGHSRPLTAAELSSQIIKIGAMLGSNVVPIVTAAPGEGPSLYGPIIRSSHQEIANLARPLGICEKCKSITLQSLKLARREIQQNDQGLSNVVYPDDCEAIELLLEGPSASRATCQMCPLTFGHHDSTTGKLKLRLYSGGSLNDPASLNYIDVEQEGKKESLLNRLLAYALPGSYSAPMINRQPPGNTESKSTLAKIRQWIKRCDICHTLCTLGLSSSQVNYPILPEKSYPVVSVRTSTSTSSTKAAWSIRSAKLPLKIGVASFSRTIREAIEITLALEFEYLWGSLKGYLTSAILALTSTVDALCIVHDDESDWKEEAPKMGSIRGNADLTLAATAAKGTEQDIFAPLQHDKIVSYLATSMTHLMVPGIMLQDKDMSRRTGHPRNDIQDHSDRGEQLNSAVVKIIRQLKIGAIPPVPAVEEYVDRSYEVYYDLHETWKDIVCQYSQCGLTFHTDKLPAVPGVETRIHEVSKIPYSAGHWFDGTIEAAAALLWCSAGNRMTRPATKRAPSWAWAALDGTLHFLPSHLDKSRPQEHDNDLKVLPFLSDEQMFEAHQVVSGKLDYGADPHVKVHHLGGKCYPDYDWHNLADNANNEESVDSFQFAAELVAQLYLSEEPLKYPSHINYTYPTEDTHQQLPVPPGIGWVTFGCEDKEAEEFGLLYVCARAFRGTHKRTASQHLALANVSTIEGVGVPAYRRVGISQEHEIDWFLDAEEQFLTLV